MARGSSKGIIIGLVVLVVVAVLIKIFGAPLYEMLKEMHGRPGGQ